MYNQAPKIAESETSKNRIIAAEVKNREDFKAIE